MHEPANGRESKEALRALLRAGSVYEHASTNELKSCASDCVALTMCGKRYCTLVDNLNGNAKVDLASLKTHMLFNSEEVAGQQENGSPVFISILISENPRLSTRSLFSHSVRQPA